MLVDFGVCKKHRPSSHLMITDHGNSIDLRRRGNLRDLFFNLLFLQVCPRLLAPIFVFLFNSFLFFVIKLFFSFPAFLSFVVFVFAAVCVFLFSFTGFFPC